MSTALAVVAVVTTLAALVGALAVLAAWGTARWRAATAALVARLDALAASPAPARYAAAELAALPAPVQRYLRRVLPAAAPIVRSVRLVHAGEFNLAADGERWKPFVSTQEVRCARRGFVWNARVRAAPGIAVRVHDAYIGGEGLLHAALLGLLPVARQQGSGAFARDELMRWLAEAAWYPTALLPGQGVHWEPIDAQRALATLRDGIVEVALEFEFGADDLIATVRAPARGRLLGGQSVPTPWEGRWSGYELRAGMWIPTAGEVAWLPRAGRRPYWRGTLTAVDYDGVPSAK